MYQRVKSFKNVSCKVINLNFLGVRKVLYYKSATANLSKEQGCIRNPFARREFGRWTDDVVVRAAALSLSSLPD